MNKYDRKTIGRLMGKAEVTATCWLWHGAMVSAGYGGVQYQGRVQPAHRVLYTILVGPVPAHLEMDHLCRVHNCVNPEHLEPVTHQENCKRGESGGDRHNAAKTHCKNGHEFAGANLYIGRQVSGGILRKCRICHNARVKKRYHELKAQKGDCHVTKSS